MKNDWTKLFAQRADEMKESDVRALFSVINKVDSEGKPTVISLAGGMPYVEGLDSSTIVEVQKRLIHEKGSHALQYGIGQGNLLLRSTIKKLMQSQNINADENNIIITTGSQSGLDIISKIFIDRGDVVLVEAPTYVGALSVFRSYQADVQHIMSDANGISPEHLEEHIKDMQRLGKTTKLLYIVPNYNNPSGSVLSLERRKKIVEICKKYSILIIEDDPYGLLYFDSAPPESLVSIAGTENVIYVGSFSKILAPGFRVGWIMAPESLKKKIVIANEASVLSPSEFSQLFVHDYINHVDWSSHLNSIRLMYSERRDTMVESLKTLVPSVSYTIPSGGFFIWLDLPEHIDCRDLLKVSIENGVAFTPGTAFYANDGGRNNLRLSFSYPMPEKIREGIQKLAISIDAMKL